MKRILSTALLLIFLLNVLGYYGVYVGIRNQMTEQLIESFNNGDYAKTSEIEFKVPVTLPYASDMTDYHRIDGQIENQGEVYRLVKQKLFHDTLFIVCVKDTRAQKINQALADYVKTFANAPSGEKGNLKVQPLSKDFFSTLISVESNNFGWEQKLSFSDFQSGKYPQAQAKLIQPPWS